MRDALPRRPHGRFGGGGVPASPGYPFIPGGAPAVFRNTICARMNSYVHCAKVRRGAGNAEAGGWRVGARFAALLAWRAALLVWRGLCACMLGRTRACLPGIASAIASSCAWLVCSVVCAKSAAESKAGCRVAWLVLCLVRVCWVKLRT